MKQLNTKYTLLERIVHLFKLIGFIFKTIFQELRKKRTWTMIFLIVAFYIWGWFNSNYFLQSPIKEFQPMVVPRYSVKPIKKLTTTPAVMAQVVEPKPVPLTEEQIVKQAKYGEELWNIYFLESTRGKNDGCRREGKFAGFGVMSLGKPACYDTFQLAVERASYWYEKIRSKNNLDTSLCIWNTGTAQPMCHYSMTYHTL